MIARFGPKNHDVDGQPLPPDFFDDFVKVAVDEATHYRLLDERLREYDAHFGSLPVQHGLWESAQTTQHDVLARLAIVHMVHEVGRRCPSGTDI